MAVTALAGRAQRVGQVDEQRLVIESSACRTSMASPAPSVAGPRPSRTSAPCTLRLPFSWSHTSSADLLPRALARGLPVRSRARPSRRCRPRPRPGCPRRRTGPGRLRARTASGRWTSVPRASRARSGGRAARRLVDEVELDAVHPGRGPASGLMPAGLGSARTTSRVTSRAIASIGSAAT